MNYDTVKYCAECKRPKPREGFSAIYVSPKGQKARVVCADCRERLMELREEAKKRSAA